MFLAQRTNPFATGPFFVRLALVHLSFVPPMTTVSYVGALPLIIHSMRAKYGSCPFCYHTTPRIPLVANIGEHVLRQVKGVKQCKDQWDDGDCKVSA